MDVLIFKLCLFQLQSAVIITPLYTPTYSPLQQFVLSAATPMDESSPT